MNELANILDLAANLTGLARDIIDAVAKGKDVRVEDILPESVMPITLLKQVKDARAKVRFTP